MQINHLAHAAQVFHGRRRIHYGAAGGDHRTRNIQRQNGLLLCPGKIIQPFFVNDLLQAPSLPILDQQVRVKKILQQQLGCHHPAGGFAAAGHTDQYDIAAVCLHFLVLNSSLFGGHTHPAASTVCQGTPLALGAASRANIPSKQHNAVAKIRPHIRGNDLL